ncbi:hypothetical protein [Peribacillus frigoritolerans]|uniref:hypothetical protein n=1 Tax=Peribacillus frigoritolerans TaxID=450367 RepID=UPI0020C10592|nr:hypothetical protein [Peribacillus frigoritolerans]
MALKGARAGPLAARKGAQAGILKGVLAGNDPLPERKGALAGNDPLPERKGALAGKGDRHAADKGAQAETGAPPTTAGGSAAITFAINGNGASNFTNPF